MLHPFVRRMAFVTLCVLLEIARYYLGLGRALCAAVVLLLALGYHRRKDEDETDGGLNVAVGVATGLALFPTDATPPDHGAACVVWALLMALDVVGLLPAQVSEPAVRCAACVLALATLAQCRSGGHVPTVEGLCFAFARGALFAVAEGHATHASRQSMRRFGALLFAPTTPSLAISAVVLLMAQHASSLARELDLAPPLFLNGATPSPIETAPLPPPAVRAAPFLVLPHLPPLPKPLPPPPPPTAALVDSLDVKEAFRLAQAQYLCSHGSTTTPAEDKNV